MTPSGVCRDHVVMSESELRKKHVAEEQAAKAQLVDAMRQAGVDVFILGTGASRFDIYAERSGLFAVLALQTPDPKAKRRMQRFLAWDSLRIGHLERGDGAAPVEFIALIDVASHVGELSQHPAMVV